MQWQNFASFLLLWIFYRFRVWVIPFAFANVTGYISVQNAHNTERWNVKTNQNILSRKLKREKEKKKNIELNVCRCAIYVWIDLRRLPSGTFEYLHFTHFKWQNGKLKKTSHRAFGACSVSVRSHKCARQHVKKSHSIQNPQQRIPHKSANTNECRPTARDTFGPSFVNAGNSFRSSFCHSLRIRFNTHEYLNKY